MSPCEDCGMTAGHSIRCHQYTLESDQRRAQVLAQRIIDAENKRRKDEADRRAAIEALRGRPHEIMAQLLDFLLHADQGPFDDDPLAVCAAEWLAENGHD